MTIAKYTEWFQTIFIVLSSVNGRFHPVASCLLLLLQSEEMAPLNQPFELLKTVRSEVKACDPYNRFKRTETWLYNYSAEGKERSRLERNAGFCG